VMVGYCCASVAEEGTVFFFIQICPRSRGYGEAAEKSGAWESCGSVGEWAVGAREGFY
jgi:hypothetical protein